jgi:hypothetical protein
MFSEEYMDWLDERNIEVNSRDWYLHIILSEEDEGEEM